jgi:hypothetical protein
MVFERCLGYFPHGLQHVKQGRKKINIGIKNQKKNGCVTLWPCHLHETISSDKRKIMKIKIFCHAKI